MLQPKCLKKRQELWLCEAFIETCTHVRYWALLRVSRTVEIEAKHRITRDRWGWGKWLEHGRQNITYSVPPCSLLTSREKMARPFVRVCLLFRTVGTKGLAARRGFGAPACQTIQNAEVTVGGARPDRFGDSVVHCRGVNRPGWRKPSTFAAA